MNCDPIARWYRWLEYAGFGRALERRRERFLGDVADSRRVLALGDGDGRALAALLRANPQARADYMDLSGKMLALAQSRAGGERVAYYRANALTDPLPGSQYDLIVTHFFLDCFDAAAQECLLSRVGRAAAPGARWIVSEFRKPGLLVAMLYWFFGLTTGLGTRKLVDHHPAFERHGFRLERFEAGWGGFLSSELWSRR